MKEWKTPEIESLSVSQTEYSSFFGKNNDGGWFFFWRLKDDDCYCPDDDTFSGSFEK